MCDRVLIMSRGRAVVEGSPAALMQERLGSEVLDLDCTPEEERALLAGDDRSRTLRVGAPVHVRRRGCSAHRALAATAGRR